MKKIIFLIFIFALLLPIKSLAQNSTEQILSFNSAITVNTDASINVKETIEYNLPSARHGIYRYIPYRYLDKTTNQYFETPVTVLSVTNEKNIPWQFSESRSNSFVEIKIGDPNLTVEGKQIYILSYTVQGVINYFSDHDELYWNVTGDSADWNNIAINNVTTVVSLPDGIDSRQLQLACYTGATGSTAQNCQKSFARGNANFSATSGPLTIVIGFNKGIVNVVSRQYEQPSGFDKLWNIVHHESGWYLLIIPISFFLLLLRYFRAGKDPFGRGTIAPEFEPPDNLKPAQMGTLLDEKADNQDISSTIIDLAVRGYLIIKEKDKKFTLIKTEKQSNLNGFEKDVYDGLFGANKDVKLKEIYETFGDVVGDIKDHLYQNLVDKKYFHQDPNKVRIKNFWIGCLVMFFAPGLFIFSTILAFSVFTSAILFLFFVRSTPKKTRQGVIAKEKVLGFKEFLYRAERYRVQWQEKEGIFEKYLPYAMVFGIAEIWAKNFKDIYKQPPDWYQGDWTTFNAVYLATSLSSFSSHASSSFSPPSTSASSGSSGFGGGGSSGGGFGGGGGGSW